MINHLKKMLTWTIRHTFGDSAIGVNWNRLAIIICLCALPTFAMQNEDSKKNQRTRTKRTRAATDDETDSLRKSQEQALDHHLNQIRARNPERPSALPHSPEITAFLRQRNLDLHLVYAVIEEKPERVKELLDRGADVNASEGYFLHRKDEAGMVVPYVTQTPMHAAIECGREEMALLLLDHGMVPTIEHLDLAEQKNMVRLAEAIKREFWTEELIKIEQVEEL